MSAVIIANGAEAPDPDRVDCAPGPDRAIGAEASAIVAATLKALAEPLRLRILSAIATDPRGESCVCDLASLAEVSQPTLSHHLKVMRDAGVLVSERRSTWVWYRIVPARRGAVTALLESFAPAAVEPKAALTSGPNAAPGAQLSTVDGAVTSLAEALASKFTNLNRDLVIATARESYAGLVRAARPTEETLTRAERFAGQRLEDLSRRPGTSAPQVLFVCVANAGRSQLAAALLTKLSSGRVVARSAGSNPAAAVHANVAALLSEIEGAGGVDGRDAAFPKPLTDDAVRAADVVVTMGCGDVCPIIPGIRYEDWPVGDPALASDAGAAAIRDDIAARVRALLDTLAPNEGPAS